MNPTFPGIKAIRKPAKDVHNLCTENSNILMKESEKNTDAETDIAIHELEDFSL